MKNSYFYNFIFNPNCFYFSFFISYLISFKSKYNFEKSSPFECGFTLFNSPRNPFSLRFFIISVIFLIFEIEVIRIFPLMMNLYLCNSIYWEMLMFISMIIVIWGLIHEWFLGSLEWI